MHFDNLTSCFCDVLRCLPPRWWRQLSSGSRCVFLDLANMGRCCFGRCSAGVAYGWSCWRRLRFRQNQALYTQSKNGASTRLKYISSLLCFCSCFSLRIKGSINCIIWRHCFKRWCYYKLRELPVIYLSQVWRGWHARQQYLRMRCAQVVIASYFKGFRVSTVF